jgi:gluconate 2-dehydrogenase gamma chain
MKTEIALRKMTRRFFLATVGAAAAASRAVTAAASRLPGQTRLAPALSPAPGYLFFAADEARFVAAACERLIPSDRSGPGALDAGVPRYLDEQLAGGWGSGRLAYRSGPWQPGTPLKVQFAVGSPADLFRTALTRILRDLNARGLDFAATRPASQARYLRALEAGAADLDGVPSAVFFDMLLGMTVEGFFSHPRFGSTRDRLAWPLRGFPGAHARLWAAPREAG